jgi:GrpB-like predicted nucleotidyltransferase (UPF0157 family)
MYNRWFLQEERGKPRRFHVKAGSIALFQFGRWDLLGGKRKIISMFDQVKPIIGPYASQPAVCRDYDPRTAVIARQIIALISSHLPHIHAEHIGSTSVPGCAGKGIIDLMVPVRDEEMDQVNELLDRLGFQRQTGRDPFPEDRPMRVGSWQQDGETFLLHIHVIPANLPEIEEMRFFRTCLQADPDLMKAYVAQKRKIIASGITDSLDYCKAKGEFLKAVLS